MLFLIVLPLVGFDVDRLVTEVVGIDNFAHRRLLSLQHHKLVTIQTYQNNMINFLK